MRSPLFVFPTRQSQGLQMNTKGGFLFSFDCRVANKQNYAACQSAPQVEWSTTGAEEKRNEENE